jgi:hypothetical protein
MIQKAQTQASHRQIRMAECRDLHRGHGDLIAETRSAFFRERELSVDEIMRDFEVTSRHLRSILLTATEQRLHHPICWARGSRHGSCATAEDDPNSHSSILSIVSARRPLLSANQDVTPAAMSLLRYGRDSDAMRSYCAADSHCRGPE